MQRAQAAEESTQEAQREADELRQQVSHHTQHSHFWPGQTSETPLARLRILLISTRYCTPGLQVMMVYLRFSVPGTSEGAMRRSPDWRLVQRRRVA